MKSKIRTTTLLAKPLSKSSVASTTNLTDDPRRTCPLLFLHCSPRAREVMARIPCRDTFHQRALFRLPLASQIVLEARKEWGKRQVTDPQHPVPRHFPPSGYIDILLAVGDTVLFWAAAALSGGRGSIYTLRACLVLGLVAARSEQEA